MSENEHMLDDSPLTKEKIEELKKSAESMLKDIEKTNVTKDKTKTAIASA